MAACRMVEQVLTHIPVLLQEAVDLLVQSPSGIYVDATFGRGSHSAAILKKLNKDGRLIAFDKDLDAIAHATQFMKDSRFSIHHTSFASLSAVLSTLDCLGRVDGVLFDLGVSSPQLDTPERGFSFVREGRLDMRMDTSRGVDAAEWIATVAEQDLADVLWQYGEEKFARRIARAILRERAIAPITTTTRLAEIITRAIPSKNPEGKHAATRSFQAIRIMINHELSDLESVLPQALEALAIGGRLAVISFHSLEDRIVKQFIRLHEKGVELPRGLPIKQTHAFGGQLKSISKAVKPSPSELNLNPRARSAILRIAEKKS